jgi:hypothetical protein
VTGYVKKEGLAYPNRRKTTGEGLARKCQRLCSMEAYATAIVMAFVLAGCTSVKPTYTQAGQAGYTINCPSDSREDCYSEAGNKCGQRGYDIAQQSVGQTSISS